MLESLLADADSAQPWLVSVRNVAFGALLATCIEQVYTRYGHCLANRSTVARHGLSLSVSR